MDPARFRASEKGLLRSRFDQRLLLLSLLAATAGSALMALITAGSVLVISTRQAEREDRRQRRGPDRPVQPRAPPPG